MQPKVQLIACRKEAEYALQNISLHSIYPTYFSSLFFFFFFFFLENVQEYGQKQ
jgi:hypothetical protein